MNYFFTKYAFYFENHSGIMVKLYFSLCDYVLDMKTSLFLTNRSVASWEILRQVQKILRF